MAVRSTRFTPGICSSRRRRWRNWAWTGCFLSLPRSRPSSRIASPRPMPSVCNCCASRSPAKRTARSMTRKCGAAASPTPLIPCAIMRSGFPARNCFISSARDNAAKLTEWREAVELAKLAVFVVVPRPGGAEAHFTAPFRGRVLKGFPLGVSSSQIRARVQKGLSIEHLVPTAVAGAIQAAGLYGMSGKS